VYSCHFFTIEHEQVLRTDLNNSEIRYTKKICIFLTRGCVHTLLTPSVYASDFALCGGGGGLVHMHLRRTNVCAIYSYRSDLFSTFTPRASRKHRILDQCLVHFGRLRGCASHVCVEKKRFMFAGSIHDMFASCHARWGIDVLNVFNVYFIHVRFFYVFDVSSTFFNFLNVVKRKVWICKKKQKSNRRYS